MPANIMAQEAGIIVNTVCKITTENAMYILWRKKVVWNAFSLTLIPDDRIDFKSISTGHAECSTLTPRKRHRQRERFH